MTVHLDLTPEEMWAATLGRDAQYDGLFVLAVRSTGVFCRPSCPARKPRRQNVEFFGSPGAAVAAGYRPCRRCRPLGPDRQPPWAAALLEELERDPNTPLTDKELKRRGLAPETVRRHFQAHFGLTFHAYTRARRLAGAYHALRTGRGVTDSGFDSGFSSSSGFREAFERLFGTTPARARNGHGDGLFVQWFPSPLGPLIAGATSDGLVLLEFSDRRAIRTQCGALQERLGLPIVPGTNEHLNVLKSELAAYFEGGLRAFTTPLVVAGTPFEERVWRALLEIPYGQTRSYEAIAEAVGSPKATRAVGRANGRNRIAIVIPCHRVVNKDGRLGGYGGGLRRKEWLLELERGVVTQSPRTNEKAHRP